MSNDSYTTGFKEPGNLAIFFFKLLYLLIYFYSSIVPMGLIPWEIRVVFLLRGKPAATESRYLTYGACCVF